MPQHTFTYVTHSHLLGGIAAFGSRLPPFLPCTLALSEAEGLRTSRTPLGDRVACLLTTSGVGVTPTWTRFASCQRAVALCRSASYTWRIGFERTGRTTGMQPICSAALRKRLMPTVGRLAQKASVQVNSSLGYDNQYAIRRQNAIYPYCPTTYSVSN